jgi:hypothetical protein
MIPRYSRPDGGHLGPADPLPHLVRERARPSYNHPPPSFWLPPEVSGGPLLPLTCGATDLASLTSTMPMVKPSKRANPLQLGLHPQVPDRYWPC